MSLWVKPALSAPNATTKTNAVVLEVYALLPMRKHLRRALAIKAVARRGPTGRFVVLPKPPALKQVGMHASPTMIFAIRRNEKDAGPTPSADSSIGIPIKPIVSVLIRNDLAGNLRQHAKPLLNALRGVFACRFSLIDQKAALGFAGPTTRSNVKRRLQMGFASNVSRWPNSGFRGRKRTWDSVSPVSLATRTRILGD